MGWADLPEGSRDKRMLYQIPSEDGRFASRHRDGDFGDCVSPLDRCNRRADRSPCSRCRAMAGSLQCVPYAREVSGIDIRGNAKTWWSQAEGRYERGNEPEVGAVLVLPPTGAMPQGHVAVVGEIVDDRHVLPRPRQLVGPGQDRAPRAGRGCLRKPATGAEVRVWYAPIGKLGLRAEPDVRLHLQRRCRSARDPAASAPSRTRSRSAFDRMACCRPGAKLGLLNSGQPLDRLVERRILLGVA